MKNKISQKGRLIGIIMLALAFGAILIVIIINSVSVKESKDSLTERNGTLEFREVQAPVSDELYYQECGSCHLAYSPSLLPKRSWYVIMIELNQHFGKSINMSEIKLISSHINKPILYR